VVQYGYIERFGSACQPPRSLAVRIAWLCIAAWVVVRQDDAAAAVSRCIEDDSAHGHADRLRLTFIIFNVNAAGSLVDVSDP
jgi:hypothetical protein